MGWLLLWVFSAVGAAGGRSGDAALRGMIALPAKSAKPTP